MHEEDLEPLLATSESERKCSFAMSCLLSGSRRNKLQSNSCYGHVSSCLFCPSSFLELQVRLSKARILPAICDTCRCQRVPSVESLQFRCCQSVCKTIDKLIRFGGKTCRSCYVLLARHCTYNSTDDFTFGIGGMGRPFPCSSKPCFEVPTKRTKFRELTILSYKQCKINMKNDMDATDYRGMI